MSNAEARSPYDPRDWPKSDGRIFLAQAFAFFCSLEWGYAPDEVDQALRGSPDLDDGVRQRVAGAAKELGRVFQQGRVETYARPFGGGSPRLLPQSTWELDDFGIRFAKCALDPSRPYDRGVEPTHWIFVNSQQFDDLIGLLDSGGAMTIQMTNARADADERASADPRPTRPNDRLIKKAEVISLVPFSRSTLDDRIRKKLFPKGTDLGGGIVVWWESDVREWMSLHGPKTAESPASR